VLRPRPFGGGALAHQAYTSDRLPSAPSQTGIASDEAVRSHFISIRRWLRSSSSSTCAKLCSTRRWDCRASSERRFQAQSASI